ncbi:ADP-ribosylglycohydrolase family protein [Isachenkonia alkalipeptolytica]|uniref:ADP-ribosylglycohydrolase family protein n=1 Tax=Isachenkonia alkalipeptolytica TaxID=2565777 RepID=A0AA44BDZ5_9CLOT|nr:ADP-ribosylglycohydrolase family protein [Isachenkonia alkalipeptolytica]NBG88482.1 ADP-ribosylglycohydrolase family protein [Isachenkonia alkalipeptolytica]
MKRSSDYFRGCLLGGAIGDALGWPVEFMSYREILEKYGVGGIRDLTLSSRGVAEITDDTQMTLFTAEGILRAQNRFLSKGICHIPSVVYYAYQRWLYTQGYNEDLNESILKKSWLLFANELFHQRAPGGACVSSLLSGKQGSIQEPVNNSKGCGALARTAPLGLMFRKNEAFDVAMQCAALTHGHPSAYLSAGALAYLISSIIAGEELEPAVTSTLLKLEEYDNHQECSEKINMAIELSKLGFTNYRSIAKIGEGWLGEEALGISIYCAVKYQNSFKKALIAAVNHDGDSDSTGAITGNILGAYNGVANIPGDWISKIELRDVLVLIADDLLKEYDEETMNWERYPGY